MPWSGKYQVEQCDECGDIYPRAMLVRKLIETGVARGQNLFIYSSYNTALWEVLSASEEGPISMGTFLDGKDGYRPRFEPLDSPDGFNVVEAQGSYTFSGNGIVRSTVATDISTWSQVYFRVDVGRYHANNQPGKTITAVIGYYDGTYYPRATYQVGGQSVCTFFDLVSDIPVGLNKSAANFYVDVTIDADVSYSNSDYWWVDMFHLSSIDGPGPVLYSPVTEGATADVQAGLTYGLPILCASCRDRTYRPSLNVTGPYNVAGWMEIKTEAEAL